MKIIKNFIGYAFLGALIGFLISGVVSLGIVGLHGTCKGSFKGCERCMDYCQSSCFDGCESCFGSIFGALGGCLVGCMECKGSGCIGGFLHGCWVGCSEEQNCHTDGLHGCVESCKDCGTGYKKCGEGLADDCDQTKNNFLEDEVAKKRAKSLLIYVTTIFAVIGAVFGIGIGGQEKKEAKRNNDLLDAINNGNKETAQKLIEAGADVDYTSFIDCKQRNLLQIAVEKSDKEMVSLLLEYGADVNRSIEQKTPLDFAKNDAIKKLLKGHGAKTKTEMEKEETAKKMMETTQSISTFSSPRSSLSESQRELLHQILSKQDEESTARDFLRSQKMVSDFLNGVNDDLIKL